MQPLLCLIVTERGSHTFRDFLNDWGGATRNYINLHTYEEKPKLSQIKASAYVFTDLERLDDAGLREAEEMAREIDRYFPGARIINHPSTILTRLPLLDKLYGVGINPFRAASLSSLPLALKPPVFIREIREHTGTLTALIHGELEYWARIFEQAWYHKSFRNLMAVEFLDTSDEFGVYRKYSVFRFGDQLLPAHMVFSNDWCAKDGAPHHEGHAEEERIFLEENQHRESVRRVFELAHIDYGRIDYSLKDGKIVVWEINTNPILLRKRKDYEEYLEGNPRKNAEMAIKERLATQLQELFMRLSH